MRVIPRLSLERGRSVKAGEDQETLKAPGRQKEDGGREERDVLSFVVTVERRRVKGDGRLSVVRVASVSGLRRWKVSRALESRQVRKKIERTQRSPCRMDGLMSSLPSRAGTTLKTTREYLFRKMRRKERTVSSLHHPTSSLLRLQSAHTYPLSSSFPRTRSSFLLACCSSV